MFSLSVFKKTPTSNDWPVFISWVFASKETSAARADPENRKQKVESRIPTQKIENRKYTFSYLILSFGYFFS